MVNQKRMLAEFFELVKIKCSTKNEREVADLIKKRLTEMGLTVTEDDTGEKIGGNCGNVLAFLKGRVENAPRILLSAHLDCVEPCGGVEPVIENGLIKSAGNTILGADDKAGVVAILEAIRVIREKNIPHGDIQAIFTVAEEGGVNGSKNLDPTLITADLGFVLDSNGEVGKIITQAPGQDSIQVMMRGKKAHAGIAPEEGINAVIVAAKALSVLKDGRIDSETTANVGRIEGGGATNIVPDEVSIFAEARSLSPEKLKVQTEHMRKTFEDTAKDHNTTAQVTVRNNYQSFSIDEQSPIVLLVKTAAAAIGLKPFTEATGGGSDANFYNKYGLPTVVLGIGMTNVHTTEEYISEQDLYDSGRLVVAIIAEAVKGKL